MVKRTLTSWLLLLLMLVITGQLIAAGLPDSARPYAPRGGAVELFYARDPELLLSGPAGTGKSRALLEKLHLCAMKYAGMRGLIARKTRASLTESGLVTYEEKVLPAGSRIKLSGSRRYRQAYRYQNGSQVIVGGMDDPNRVMSTEYDLIVPLEATELTEEDLENLTTRLRNGVMPYQQLLADCNPGGPQHWLKKRSERGTLRLIESRHEDNPILFDERGQMTEVGRAYLAKLDNLTGVRKLRLRYGIWAMSEGMVYADVWDPARHLLYRTDGQFGLAQGIPRDWPRVWVVDFGYTNPFVWQCWAIDGDGRMFRLAEIYQTKTLVEDHARTIRAWQEQHAEPAPIALVCDHDAEDRATLERHLGISTTAAHKAVSEGIQTTAARLRVAGDGKARLFLLRDALLKVDEELREAKKPTCTEEEVEGYVWAEGKEVPLKRDDHGVDALRYAVCYVDLQQSQGVF